jgi:thioredoxin reductase (NADPH)
MTPRDIVVVGAGPAGLTAALYAGRSRLSVLLVEMMMPGGWAAMTDVIENYPGAGAVKGADLAARMAEQAVEVGAELATATVKGIGRDREEFLVRTGAGEHRTRSVIVASGSDFRKLGVPGELELAGHGVSYCATCDGPFFQGRKIAVVGGGDSALQEALYLTKFAEKIYLIHRRDDVRAVPVLAERVDAHEKIECLCSTVVERINGEEAVESVDLASTKTGEKRTIEVAGVFLFIGLEPRTAFLGDLVDLDDRGFILTDDQMKTSARGVLAAGDCRAKLLRQVSTAVGDGATAAFAAQLYLDDGEW